jgi:hypothetical protein
VVCQPAKCPNCTGEETDSLAVPAPDEDGCPPVLEYYDPPTDETEVVLIDTSTLGQAQERIARCEYCTSDAELTFDYILDAVTGCDPTVTQYVLCAPARCPYCFHEINEKSLVIPE